MDDDVEVLPDALLSFGRWTSRFGCMHGRRWDHDGTPFFWQTRINSWLGIFYPQPGDVFKTKDYFLTNSGTFEGMLIRRDVVEKIGLPDPRFFLTWDDAVYAWLASRVTDVAERLDAFVLRRPPARSAGSAWASGISTTPAICPGTTSCATGLRSAIPGRSWALPAVWFRSGHRADVRQGSSAIGRRRAHAQGYSTDPARVLGEPDYFDATPRGSRCRP